MYEDVAAISRIINKMADNFTHDDDTISGTISIAVASHVHSPAFDATLADFHQHCPQSDLQRLGVAAVLIYGWLLQMAYIF